MSEIFDLHCHSTASDGSLSPTQLMQRAKCQGVTALALTDHDTVAGLPEARRAASQHQLRLIPGIELSSTWQGKCLHIVGLDIDPGHPDLLHATASLQSTRLHRAEIIASKLEKKRIFGALDEIQKTAGDSMITRTHFAKFLVKKGHVDNLQEAFDRYLAKGKPAYVSTPWDEMSTAIGWINRAGGIAVLAHPLRYRLTGNWMKRLLSAFKEAGGCGIEVITGRISDDEIRQIESYARRFDLAGSCGSDFHTPDQPWIELGRLRPLPDGITPIWQLLPSIHGHPHP